MEREFNCPRSVRGGANCRNAEEFPKGSVQIGAPVPRVGPAPNSKFVYSIEDLA